MLLRKYSSSTPLRIVVLLAPPPVQLLDLAPIDLFHMLRSDYLSRISTIPEPIKALGLDNVEIVYVADTEPVTTTSTSGRTNDLLRDVARANIQFAPLTANVQLGIDKSISDPDVQPGQVSILLVPGPDPGSMPSEACQRFLNAHAASGLTDIITISTGIYPACMSGVCDGKTVTGPRESLSDLRQQFPEVRAFEDRRWSVDSLLPRALSQPQSESASSPATVMTGAVAVSVGKDTLTPVPDPPSPPPIATDSKLRPLAAGQRPAELWTAGGITNGQDTVAAYIRAHFESELAEAILQLADLGQRRRDYDTGHVRGSARRVSTVFKTIFKGMLPGNGRKRSNGSS